MKTSQHQILGSLPFTLVYFYFGTCIFVFVFVYLYLFWCIWIFEFKYFHSMKQQSISQWKLVNTRSSALYLSQVFHQISPQLVSKSWLVLHFISLERFILCFYRIYGKILGFSRTVNLRNSCWPAAYHINTFHPEVFLSFSKALKLRFSISCKCFNEKCNFSTYWHFEFWQYRIERSNKLCDEAWVGILYIW